MLDSMRFDEFQSLENHDTHDMSWLHDAGVATQGRLQELAVVERCGETPDFAEGRQIRQMGQTLHLCSTVKCFNPTLSERVPECQMMWDVSRCCRGNGIMRRLSLIDNWYWPLTNIYIHHVFTLFTECESVWICSICYHSITVFLSMFFFQGEAMEISESRKHRKHRKPNPGGWNDDGTEGLQDHHRFRRDDAKRGSAVLHRGGMGHRWHRPAWPPEEPLSSDITKNKNTSYGNHQLRRGYSQEVLLAAHDYSETTWRMRSKPGIEEEDLVGLLSDGGADDWGSHCTCAGVQHRWGIQTSSRCAALGDHSLLGPWRSCLLPHSGVHQRHPTLTVASRSQGLFEVLVLFWHRDVGPRSAFSGEHFCTTRWIWEWPSSLWLASCFAC